MPLNAGQGVDSLASVPTEMRNGKVTLFPEFDMLRFLAAHLAIFHGCLEVCGTYPWICPRVYI